MLISGICLIGEMLKSRKYCIRTKQALVYYRAHEQHSDRISLALNLRSKLPKLPKGDASHISSFSRCIFHAKMAASLPAASAGTWFAATALPVLLALPLAKKKHVRRSGTNSWDAHFNPTLQQTGPQPCRLCKGDGTIPCTLCRSTGVLARGGFSRHNMVRVSSLVGSKWTSVSAIDGKWRHFLCVGKKGSNLANGVALLASTCGPVDKRIRIEVPARQLKIREVWQGGWTTLADIRCSDVVPSTKCTACRGNTVVSCPRCDGIGQVGFF